MINQRIPINQIVFERFARLNLDPKRKRRNVLKEKNILGGGKEEIRWRKRKEKWGRNWFRGRNSCS